MKHKRKIENMSVEQLHKIRGEISFPEYQRQPHLWTDEKKRLLIDSILEDIDIPKLYFNRTGTSSFEVVDGQQRLWAIWDFLDGGYEISIDGKQRKFTGLPKAEQETIKKYTLQVTVFDGADDPYLRELFVRLQLGLLLITGEKLHAANGVMKDFVFGKMVRHQFIQKLGIPPRRFARETLCAQICINSFARAKIGSFARTRYEDLIALFREYEDPVGKDKEFFASRIVIILKVLDELMECFGASAAALRNRSLVLSLYLLVEDILGESRGMTKEQRDNISAFTNMLWKRLREEARAGFDRRNRELYSLQGFMSSAPGERYQIEGRHLKLQELFGYFEKGRTIKGDKAAGHG
jgi:hypothetical protein